MVDREVITFLMTDPHFPRAVGYCLAELNNSLRALPRYEAALRGVLRLQRITADLDVGPMDLEDLREFIDTLQLDLSYVHDRIADLLRHHDHTAAAASRVPGARPAAALRGRTRLAARADGADAPSSERMNRFIQLRQRQFALDFR